jgi:hypothetical protein
LAPDFKFTEINGDFANLAGAYGGWLINKKPLLGGGGYTLTNGADHTKMTYGGFVLEYFIQPTVSWISQSKDSWAAERQLYPDFSATGRFPHPWSSRIFPSDSARETTPGEVPARRPYILRFPFRGWKKSRKASSSPSPKPSGY